MKPIDFARPYYGLPEFNSVLASLQRPILTNGPILRQFEDVFQEYVGGGVAVAVSSCASALWMAYRVIGLAPGDEVICPALTHVSTAHAIELNGGIPRFVDVDGRGLMNMTQAGAMLDARTKAIAPVHFMGSPVDLAAILPVCEKKNIKIVEDCALALGASWRARHVGLNGDIGCFSFYPCKHITTGEGGMFLTKRVPYAEDAARCRQFGQNLHDRDVKSLGLNMRMTEMQAALGIAQISRLNKIMEIRRRNYSLLFDMIKDMVQVIDHSDGSWYALCFILPEGKSRGGIREALKQRGIDTSIYYEVPVPMMMYYRKKYGLNPADYPMADMFSKRSMCLPVGPHIDVNDIHLMAEQLGKVLA